MRERGLGEGARGCWLCGARRLGEGPVDPDLAALAGCGRARGFGAGNEGPTLGGSRTSRSRSSWPPSLWPACWRTGSRTLGRGSCLAPGARGGARPAATAYVHATSNVPVVVAFPSVAPRSWSGPSAAIDTRLRFRHMAPTWTRPGASGWVQGALRARVQGAPRCLPAQCGITPRLVGCRSMAPARWPRQQRGIA